MKLRFPLAAAILVPVALTIAATAVVVMVLAAISNMATVQQTLADRQDEMIEVLTQQFAGSVRFAKMDAVQQSFEQYQADPDFGLTAAGAVDAQGKPILEFGDDPAEVKASLAAASEALASQHTVSIRSGSHHIAAVPAYFGKDNEVVGAIVMNWDLSIHDAAIVSQQLTNGLIALGVAAVAIVALALFLMRHVTMPMRRLTRISTALVEGDLDIAITGTARGDELGDMARAVEVFRANSQKVRDLTDEEAARILNDKAARQRMMAELQGAFGKVVDAAIAGDFSRRVAADFPDDELNSLAGSVNALVETVDRGLGETAEVMSSLAETNLTRRMTGEYQGAFARLKADTNRVAENLSAIATKLKRTSFDLKTATGEILSGANDLSERTTKQAATIEETSAAMEQLAETVQQNAKRAGDAATNAGSVTLAAEDGGQVMHEATAAMERITTSSSKISSIIGMIDDIAFQTNLLALNASVEAARAGEAGKGFAVVAIEVRRLAQSAAQASAEVKTLIEQSGSEVSTGSRLVAQAAAKLEVMVAEARKNNDLLEGIARESRDQASAIDEVTVAIRQMDEMTQHNAALVEETNAAIEQTEAQAVELDRIVEIFDLGEDAQLLRTPVTATPPARSGKRALLKSVTEKVANASKSYLSDGNTALDREWSEC
jgi:methyl-accepting chemotaxis protein